MKLKNKGTDEFRCLTRHGGAKLKIRRWRGVAPDGTTQTFRPAYDALGSMLCAISLALAHLMVRMCLASQSFRAAQTHMIAVGLPEVAPETLRKLVLAEGEAAQQALDQQAIDPGWQAQGCPNANRDGSAVVIGVDGVMIPTNTDDEKAKRRNKTLAKRAERALDEDDPPIPLAPRRTGTDRRYKEVKVVGLYGVDSKDTMWRVTTGDHKDAAAMTGRMARKVRFDQADERLAVTDGAPWIEHRLQDDHLNLKLTAHILDFFHFAQHVHKAADALHEQASDAQAWAGEIKTIAKTQGPDALLAALRACEPGTAEGQQALDGLLGYLEPRQDMIDYPTYLANGWPIGSGPTESACKGTTRFIKGRGKRWDLDNAQAMMSLEALDMSGQLEAFFTHRRNQAA